MIAISIHYLFAAAKKLEKTRRTYKKGKYVYQLIADEFMAIYPELIMHVAAMWLLVENSIKNLQEQL